MNVEIKTILFLFNDKPIQFEFTIKINRSEDYLHMLRTDWEAYRFFFRSEDYLYRLASRFEKQIINAEQTFKSDECVICLNDPPNVLFCNCGHIAICVECSKIECFDTCPVCKTENTNLRIIEY